MLSQISIVPDSTSVTVYFHLMEQTDGGSNDGRCLTAQVATDLTANYVRTGGSSTSISLSNLAALNSVYSSGGIKEWFNGWYRLDLPNAVVAAGARQAHVSISSANKNGAGHLVIDLAGANITAINGGATDGNNAILKLRKLDIQSQAGDSYAFNVSGGSASGATPASGAVNFTGGSATTTVGGVAGAGMNVVGGAGASSTNAARYAATFDAGDDNGAGGAIGIDVTGNATAALRLLSLGVNAPGLKAVGSAGGPGILAIGGDAVTTTPAGAGFQSTGGVASTSGGGTAGSGIKATGGAGAASINGAGEGFTVTGGGTTTVSGANGASFTGTGGLNGFVITSGSGGTALSLATSGGGKYISDGAITAGVVADGTIDRATFAEDTGLQTIRSSTAQGGTASTITLDAGASATDNYYQFRVIKKHGPTGDAEDGWCIGYNGTTKVATILGIWKVTPAAGTPFQVLDGLPYFAGGTIAF
jgi:hypothetical protein